MSRALRLGVSSLSLPFVLALSACAGVTIQKEKDGTKDTGIRFYEPAPFLLVQSDSKGGVTSRIIWLPDTTQVMTVRPYAYLAKNNATFKFDKGMLTQSKSEADETVFPAAVVGALKSAALATIKAASVVAKDETATVPAPYLFRIVVKDGAPTLAEASRTPADVNVTLVPAPKK